MSDSLGHDGRSAVGWFAPAVFGAMAGGMAWGIRGQYGHETGAMLAGLLVSLTLVTLLCPRASLLGAARAVALGTVAIGFGGSMTYGQTVGLTHDPELVGNWAALGWGMLGLVAANSLQLTAHALITLWLIRRRVGQWERMGLLAALRKVLAASLTMGAATFGVYRLLDLALPGIGIVRQALRLGAAGGVGLAVYALTAFWLRVDEARLVLNLVRKKTGH